MADSGLIPDSSLHRNQWRPPGNSRTSTPVPPAIRFGQHRRFTTAEGVQYIRL